MKRLGFATVLAFAAIFSSTAEGAVEGVAFLNTFRMRLFEGAAPGSAVVLDPITNGDEITVTAALFSSTAQANVLSIAGGPVATSAGPGPSPIFLDTAIAQEGSAVANNSLFPPPVGAGAPAPYGTNLAGPLPHSLGDTWGSGSIIEGLTDPLSGAAIPFGAELRKTAQTDLSIIGAPLFDSGTADARDTSSGSFNFTVVGGSLNIVAIFDAARFLLADATPTPPGSLSSASSSWSITITAAGATNPLFSWAPDGLPGGILGGTEFSDPFTLNGSITAVAGTTSTDIDESESTVEAIPPLAPGDYFAAGVTLGPGSYSFTVTENVTTQVTALGAIPEPSAILVWGLLAMCVGGVSVWRKRTS